MNNQETIIYNLLGKLEEKYLTSDKIRRAILEGNIAKQEEIEFIDALFQTVITSLNFGNYKRAVKYLALIEKFCRSEM
ncbi:MAG: hypothetical protein IJQ85_10370 [Selenomonadaceae bacterium]|nr:hypothetical protein [Selenomonadaceae bacterium]